MNAKTHDIKDIAKQVRKDIKAAIKEGKLPNVKISVRISRYSMGQSMNVTVETWHRACLISPRWFKSFVIDQDHDAFGPNGNISRYTKEAAECKETLKKIVGKYNYNNSDFMTDYHDVGFYDYVDFSGKLTDNFYRAAKKAFAAMEEK